MNAADVARTLGDAARGPCLALPMSVAWRPFFGDSRRRGRSPIGVVLEWL
jgi:hypothetical protein